MSGKISAEDIFITVGAFILVLGLYQRVKPILSLEADVVPDRYPAIRPTPPEESENDKRSRRWTKKYGCRKVIMGGDNKWTNLCTGVGSGEGVHVAPPLYSGETAPDFDNILGQTQTQSSVYARAYPGTRVADDSDRLGGSDLMTVKQCSKIESKLCCKAAEFQGMVDAEAVRNCHLCNHPSCDGVTAQQDDPGISLPFKKNIVPVITPVGNYARAYAAEQLPEFYIDSLGRRVKIYDCDRPFRLGPSDIEHLKHVPPSGHPWVLNGLKKKFMDTCTRERARRQGGRELQWPANFDNLDPSTVHSHFPNENIQTTTGIQSE